MPACVYSLWNLARRKCVQRAPISLNVGLREPGAPFAEGRMGAATAANLTRGGNFSMNRMHAGIGLSVSLLLALGMTGCGSSDNSNNNSGGGSVGTSQVRTFNTLVPSNGNTGTLTIGANGTTLSGQSGLAYGQFNPAFGYTTVPSGTFTPSGSGTGFTTPIQLTTPSGLAANTNYTLVAAGQMGQNGTLGPQFFLVPDFNSTTTTIPTGQAAVRFINLSPGTQNFGLYSSVNGGVATPLSSNMSSVGYGFNSATDAYAFVPVQSGSTFSIRDAANPSTDVVLANGGLTGLNLQAGHAYTVYDYGQNGNTGAPLTTSFVQDF